MADNFLPANPVGQTPPPASNDSLSTGQAKFLYWFTGLIPIPKALTPLATYWGDIRKPLYDNLEPGKKAARLYQNVVTDVGRQAVTCSFQLASYFIGGDVIAAIFQGFSDDAATKHVIVQGSSLLLQVGATILSRPFGASQLIGLCQQEESPIATVKGRWKLRVNSWINGHLRAAGTQHLLPGKAAAIATGTLAVYLSSLVGVLYSISSLLEKAFPQIYKPTEPPAGQTDSLSVPAINRQAQPTWPTLPHSPMNNPLATANDSFLPSSASARQSRRSGTPFSAGPLNLQKPVAYPYQSASFPLFRGTQ